MPTHEERQETAADIVAAVIDGDKGRAEALALTLSPRVSMADIIRRYHDPDDDEVSMLAADAIDCLETVSANGAAMLEVLFGVVEELTERIAMADNALAIAYSREAEYGG